MSALIAEDEIVDEMDLVWLEDISRLDYVRQSLDRLPTRRGRPAYHRDGRMVGYALLGPKAKPSRSSGTFRRRVFWLLPHDRDTEPDGLYARGRRRRPWMCGRWRRAARGTRPSVRRADRCRPRCGSSSPSLGLDGLSLDLSFSFGSQDPVLRWMD